MQASVEFLVGAQNLMYPARMLRSVFTRVHALLVENLQCVK